MKTYLRAFEYEDLELIHQWHTDEEINLLTGGNKFFISKERERKWLEDKMLNDRNQIYCAICDTESSKIIGFTSLNEIDYINRKAFWGGLVIGDKLNRNKGFAASASIQILTYGFCELGLNKISGKWLLEHKTAIINGRMLGFITEGILRQEVFKVNKFHDVLVMSLLKANFEKRHL